MKLFVVSTPSQAFFLSKTVGIVNQKSILLVTKNLKGIDEKIISQLQIFPWAKIFVWDIEGIKSTRAYYKIFIFRLKISLLKKRYSGIDELFIGSYDNFFHLGIVAAFEDKSKLYLLYDGLQMISVAEKRAKSRTKSLRRNSKIFNLAGFKQPAIKFLTYTSPLEFKVPVFDEIIKIESSPNKLIELKDELMYFAGQPLVDMGLVSLELYLKKLAELKLKFPKYEITYFPHPKESEEVKQKVANIFKIRYFQKIFEEEYMESKFFAKNIASFYSSVLINLSYLGSGDLNIYAINLSESEILLPKQRSSILNIYKYFQANKTSNLNILRI
ncbi:hypothetical protein BC962_2360 [Gillisia mitskevichiae]|uniref:Uncharacterized protein n=1 Tax=Gillisia mitskevichiae TaxID=270921 RepID=A0A495PPJ4_9FLAO|nr:hypothetical protein [Gillisia mitskevichiae]RKS50589.1 hypothetical protein BC962_2360 [Gillisia mitskevichiae]